MLLLDLALLYPH